MIEWGERLPLTGKIRLMREVPYAEYLGVLIFVRVEGDKEGLVRIQHPHQ